MLTLTRLVKEINMSLWSTLKEIEEAEKRLSSLELEYSRLPYWRMIKADKLCSQINDLKNQIRRLKVVRSDFWG